MGLQERSLGSMLLWAQDSSSLEEAVEVSRASAGWGGPSAQLTGVMGVLAVISAQVVAKAERGPLVTFTGLPLASGSTS